MNAADASLAAAIEHGMPVLCELLTTRLHAGHSREVPCLDRELLQRTVAHCEQAIGAAQAAGRSFDAALAEITKAAALLCIDERASVEQAELALGRAIQGLMPRRASAALLGEAYQLLADLMVHVVGAVSEDERDAFIERALGVARAAEYLASCAGDDPSLARALDAQARLLGRRFSGSRDANLMAALDTAARALGRLEQVQVMAEVRWPVLMLEAGNAAMKVVPSRDTWLQQARRYHGLGRSAVDAARYPGLAEVFDRNNALYSGEAAQGLERAPDTEMFERFRQRGRRASADAAAALQVAGEMRAWASSLPNQPNAYLGHAHLFGGRVLFSASAFAEAASAFDAAASVFAEVFREDAMGRQLVAQAVELRNQALRSEAPTT